eukprot:jgi/Chrzof1/12165/Cz06g23150.t1
MLEVQSCDNTPGVPQDASLGICLFPMKPPTMATAITRGVQVRVSSVLIPEQSDYRGGIFTFSYSVRFSLLTPQQEQAAASKQQPGLEQQPEGHEKDGASSGGRGLNSVTASQPLTACQLVSRHWVIRNAAGEVENTVSGEGVVGYFPILELGGRYRVNDLQTEELVSGKGEFVYQSCTSLQNEMSGSMEGYFTFAEGTIARPTGPHFQVTCPKFNITVPHIVF